MGWHSMNAHRRFKQLSIILFLSRAVSRMHHFFAKSKAPLRGEDIRDEFSYPACGISVDGHDGFQFLEHGDSPLFPKGRRFGGVLPPFEGDDFTQHAPAALLAQGFDALINGR
uniref:Uncharacterized protein n=1 Tax=Candidatus Kentrum sp. LPFa TaxID=2126335 RepID=A0A450VZ26_9GAMM|nr:MAG: hypothetical protein BECKLPF1236A_GA0070988_1002921 [Candidatus Kentron sp. LPFa]VFK26188.1 MAG: hypothetical protein BECKLPF1236C_GA0070990_1003121 [Candidatus Kentron sp. LPFa]